MESSIQHPEEHKGAESHARTEGKRLKEGAGHTIKGDHAAMKIGGDIKFEKNPKYIEERMKIFVDLWETQSNKYKGKLPL